MAQKGIVGSGSTIRVFVVDDHELIREGLREFIQAEPDLEMAGEAGTVAAAIAGISESRPDVAVLDVRLPDGDGVELCREIRSRNPDIHCLVLTSFDDDEALFKAIMAGADGYLLKEADRDTLLDSIRRVSTGQSLLDPAITHRVLERIRNRVAPDERVARLSDQERRILDLIGEGLTNRQIGERLHLAEKTVKNYVSTIFTKLGMERRTQAAVYAATLKERQSHPPNG